MRLLILHQLEREALFEELDLSSKVLLTAVPGVQLCKTLLRSYSAAGHHFHSVGGV